MNAGASRVLAQDEHSHTQTAQASEKAATKPNTNELIQAVAEVD